MKKKFSINNQSIVFITKLEDNIETKIQGNIILQQIPNDPETLKKLPANYITEYDLLKYKVIEKSWEQSERPEFHQDIAKMSYNNGLSINAQLNKVTLLDNFLNKNNNLADISKNFYKLLQDMKITMQSVGINFTLILPSANPQDYITDTFLKTNLFKKIKNDIDKQQINLSYRLEKNHSLNINIYTAEKNKLKNVSFPEDKCVIFDANFHYDLDDNNSVENVIGSTDEKLTLLYNIIDVES